MNKLQNVEKFLKRGLKNKVKLSLATMVAFMITGVATYSTESTFIEKDNENTEIMLILSGNFRSSDNKKVENIGTFISDDKPVKPSIPWIPINPSNPITPPQDTTTVKEDKNTTETAFTLEKDKKIVVNNGVTVTVASDVKVENVGSPLEPNWQPNKIVAGIVNNGGIAENNGIIDIKGSIDTVIGESGDTVKTGEGYGVYQISGTFTNNGTIKIQGNGFDGDGDKSFETKGGVGVYITGGIATNNGTITANGSFELSDGSIGLPMGIGMKAVAGTIINGEKGLIENQHFSMYVEGKGTAINNGTINTELFGLVATDGGNAINNGTINAWFDKTGEAGKGLFASSYKGITTTITNSETGVVYGSVTAEGTGATVINNGTIYGEKIEANKGTIVNNGTITGEATKPVINVDGGKFIQGGNGKLEADTFNGDIYISGIVANNNFNDTIVKEDSIIVDNLNGEVKSDSFMFNAELQGNDVVLVRKDFHELTNKSEIADFLEGAYDPSAKENLYLADLLNNYQKITNADEFYKATNSTFGNDLLPNLSKQTLDMIKINKVLLVDNILNVDTNKDLRVIGGANYSNKDVDSTNLSGYDMTISQVFFGADKAISDNQRLGAVLNIGKLEADFDMNNADREDTFGQLNLYSIYQKDNLKIVNNLFGGMSTGDYNRTLAFQNIYSESNSDIHTNYFGLNNIVSYKIPLDSFYITPKAELNFTYMSADGIDESGRYGLKSSDMNTNSIEGVIGVELGKDIIFDNNLKLTLKTYGNINHEFGEPNKEMEVKFKNVTGNSIKLDKYDNDDTTFDLGVKAELGTDSIKGYIQYNYNSDVDENTISSGITYKF